MSIHSAFSIHFPACDQQLSNRFYCFLAFFESCCSICLTFYQQFATIFQLPSKLKPFSHHFPSSPEFSQHFPSSRKNPIILAFWPGPKVPFSTARAPSTSSRRGNARPWSCWIQRRFSRSCASRGRSWRRSEEETQVILWH